MRLGDTERDYYRLGGGRHGDRPPGARDGGPRRPVRAARLGQLPGRVAVVAPAEVRDDQADEGGADR